MPPREHANLPLAVKLETTSLWIIGVQTPQLECSIDFAQVSSLSWYISGSVFSLPDPCFKFILALTDSISLLRGRGRKSRVSAARPLTAPWESGEMVGCEGETAQGHIIKIIFTAPLVRTEPLLAHALADLTQEAPA